MATLCALQLVLRPSDSIVLASDPFLWCRVQICPHFEVVSFDDINFVRGLSRKGNVFKNLQNVDQFY